MDRPGLPLALTFGPLLCTLLSGCVGFRFEHSRIGLPDPIHEAQKLQENQTTLRETFEKLGPPDLLLRAGDRNRAYYTSWDSDYFKFIAKIEIPFLRLSSWDIFILTSGSETLHLARLDYDRAGVLRERQVLTTLFDRGGEYAALDNSLVERFLEDRDRALNVTDETDDNDDLP